MSSPISTRFNYINPLYDPKPTIFITNNNDEVTEKKIFMNNKFLNEVYFVNIDIYKYQRNFNGPYVELVMNL